MGADSYHPQESQCSRLQSGSMSFLDLAVFGGQNFGDMFDEVAFMMPLGIALASFDGRVAPFPRGASSGCASYQLFRPYVEWIALRMGCELL